MKEIVGRFEDSEEEIAKWRKAADTWRLPYWDWTTEYVPGAVKAGELKIIAMPITRAEGVSGKLENPLQRFTNPSLVPTGDDSMDRFKIPSHKDPNYGTYPV